MDKIDIEFKQLVSEYIGKITFCPPAGLDEPKHNTRYPNKAVPKFNPDDDEEWGIRWGYLYG